MEYTIYQLEFKTGVHFGTGMLNESACTFKADQIFSALYIEALKLNLQQQLYDAVKKGNLLISDAFPYIGQQYMIPKPMIYVEPVNRGESKQKKAYKKMKFIPVECLIDFLNGKMDLSNDPMEHYGHYFQQTMAAVRTGEETLPYRVGTFYYEEGCGLYIIAAYQGKNEKCLMEKLLTALSYTGIGGKKSGGLGKFQYDEKQIPGKLLESLQKKSDRYMLLSVALPADDELENALENASYLLEKRSGFVASSNYAEEWRKKRDLYVFTAGSCFVNCFAGDIYDVSEGGKHPVYRYAKPIFMGVSL